MQAQPLPPHDADAEQALLGSLLINGEAISRVETVLQPADFFRPHHQWIYEACLALSERHEPINEVTVAHELAMGGRLADIGGLPYLSELTLATPSSQHAEYYAQLVARTGLMRRIIAAGAQIAALGYEGGPDPDAVLDKAEDVLFRLRRADRVRDFLSIRQIIDDFLQRAARPMDSRADADQMPRIPTGFPALDSLLGGLHRSDLIIVAARPGVGKSSLALGFARNAAVRHRARVAMFCLEMSGEQMVERLLAGESGVDSQRLRLGTQTPAEQRRILDAAGTLADAQIFFDDTPVITTTEMRSKLRRLHAERPLDMVIVDYLQLISGSGKGGENRVAQISEISRSLKGLARELNVPLIAMSQLSRAVESRQPHIPMLSDLRESGSIEQDADIVMFIYREDMYYTEEQWEQQFPTKQYPQGIARIIVAKHRNGPTGERDLYFRDTVAKFESLAWEG